MRYVKMATLLLSLALSACAPLTPRGGSSAAEWAPSPNFGVRRANYVILHHTSNDTLAQAQRTLSDPERSVSAHYLIGRDGRLLQLVDEHHRAWHAGASWWGGHTDINSASIGIELDNAGRLERVDRRLRRVDLRPAVEHGDEYRVALEEDLADRERARDRRQVDDHATRYCTHKACCCRLIVEAIECRRASARQPRNSYLLFLPGTGRRRHG